MLCSGRRAPVSAYPSLAACAAQATQLSSRRCGGIGGGGGWTSGRLNSLPATSPALRKDGSCPGRGGIPGIELRRRCLRSASAGAVVIVGSGALISVVWLRTSESLPAPFLFVRKYADLDSRLRPRRAMSK